MFRRLAVLGSVAVLVLGCELVHAFVDQGTPAPFVGIGANNSTTMDITVAINNVAVATVPAGAGIVRITSDLPGRPFVVDARSPSGQILYTLHISASDVINDQGSRGGGVFLTCGQLELWVGMLVAPEMLPITGQTPAPCD